MDEIVISVESLKMFSAIFIAGALYGYYCYRNGLKRGWDNCAYSLQDAGLIDVNSEGEIIRISDKEYREIIKNFEYGE